MPMRQLHRVPAQRLTVALQDTSNTGGDKFYKGKWIAEIEIVRPNAKAIRGYLSLDEKVRQLRVARARVQKYSPGTPLKDKKGNSIADPKKREKLRRKVKKLQVRVAPGCMRGLS